MKFIDLTGKKFNILTVISRAECKIRAFFYCLCDCGNALVASMNKEYRTHKNYIETTEDPVMTAYMLADGALNFKYFL